MTRGLTLLHSGKKLGQLCLKSLLVYWLVKYSVHARVDTIGDQIRALVRRNCVNNRFLNVFRLWLLHQVLISFLDAFCRFIAVHYRHVDVHEDQFEVRFATLLCRVGLISFYTKFSVLCALYLNVESCLQEHLQRDYIVEVVFNNKDCGDTVASTVCNNRGWSDWLSYQ